MVDLLEVSLFAQLVVGRTGFLCDNPRFVQLFLQNGQLVGEFLIFLVNFRDLGHIRCFKFAHCFEFVPLSLELVESLLHPELDEEIAQELVGLFSFQEGFTAFTLLEVGKNGDLLLSGLQECIIIVKSIHLVLINALLLDVIGGVRLL